MIFVFLWFCDYLVTSYAETAFCKMSYWLFCLKFSSLGPFLVCALTVLLKPQYLLFEVFSGVCFNGEVSEEGVIWFASAGCSGLEYLQEG